MRSLKIALFSAAALAMTAPAFAAPASPTDQPATAAAPAKPDTASPKAQTGKAAHHKGHHKAKSGETTAPAAK